MASFCLTVPLWTPAKLSWQKKNGTNFQMVFRLNSSHSFLGFLYHLFTLGIASSESCQPNNPFNILEMRCMIEMLYREWSLLLFTVVADWLPKIATSFHAGQILMCLVLKCFGLCIFSWERQYHCSSWLTAAAVVCESAAGLQTLFLSPEIISLAFSVTYTSKVFPFFFFFYFPAQHVIANPFWVISPPQTCHDCAFVLREMKISCISSYEVWPFSPLPQKPGH